MVLFYARRWIEYGVNILSLYNFYIKVLCTNINNDNLTRAVYIGGVLPSV